MAKGKKKKHTANNKPLLTDPPKKKASKPASTKVINKVMELKAESHGKKISKEICLYQVFLFLIKATIDTISIFINEENSDYSITSTLSASKNFITILFSLILLYKHITYYLFDSYFDDFEERYQKISEKSMSELLQKKEIKKAKNKAKDVWIDCLSIVTLTIATGIIRIEFDMFSEGTHPPLWLFNYRNLAVLMLASPLQMQANNLIRYKKFSKNNVKKNKEICEALNHILPIFKENLKWDSYNFKASNPVFSIELNRNQYTLEEKKIKRHSLTKNLIYVLEKDLGATIYYANYRSISIKFPLSNIPTKEKLTHAANLLSTRIASHEANYHTYKKKIIQLQQISDIFNLDFWRYKEQDSTELLPLPTFKTYLSNHEKKSEIINLLKSFYKEVKYENDSIIIQGNDLAEDSIFLNFINSHSSKKTTPQISSELENDAGIAHKIYYRHPKKAIAQLPSHPPHSIKNHAQQKNNESQDLSKDYYPLKAPFLPPHSHFAQILFKESDFATKLLYIKYCELIKKGKICGHASSGKKKQQTGIVPCNHWIKFNDMWHHAKYKAKDPGHDERVVAFIEKKHNADGHLINVLKFCTIIKH